MANIHINRGATSLGVFSEEDVREGLRNRRFLLGDLGWREGMANWQLLSQFSEFAGEVAAAASGSPPPPAQTSAPPPVAAPLAGRMPSVGSRAGLPWDQRDVKGLVPAFIETLQLVLTKPAEAFGMMKREGGFGEPMIYALIGGCLGGVVSFLFSLGFQSLGFFGDRQNAIAGMLGMGIGSAAFLILLPVLVVICLFLGAAVVHLCLMIVGGAKQSFETTFRVLAFSQGSTGPLQMIPVCGGMVAAVWALVVNCIGLAKAHEIETGRAVFAVVLPLVVCCGGIFVTLMMFGALGAWSASQH